MTGIDKSLFDKNHYLGKPADTSDRIVTRRIEILNEHPEFFGENLKLIEVGCGNGSTITKLANRFKNCLGIDVYDYSDEFMAESKKNNANNCTFKQLDLEKELPVETYDRLISFEVIEHFRNENTVSAFNEMLNPEGLIAITVPNKWWIFETHGASLPFLPWNRIPFFSWLPTFIHERYSNARIYTLNRILSLLKKHGFEILDNCYITAPMDVLKESKFKRWLIRNMFKRNKTKIPFKSTSIFVLAKKKFQ